MPEGKCYEGCINTRAYIGYILLIESLPHKTQNTQQHTLHIHKHNHKLLSY